jgi:hypothetical protein
VGKKSKKDMKIILIIQIFLAMMLLLFVLMYLFNRPNSLPETEVFLTNTTILGKIIGM